MDLPKVFSSGIPLDGFCSQQMGSSSGLQTSGGWDIHIVHIYIMYPTLPNEMLNMAFVHKRQNDVSSPDICDDRPGSGIALKIARGAIRLQTLRNTSIEHELNMVRANLRGNSRLIPAGLL